MSKARTAASVVFTVVAFGAAAAPAGADTPPDQQGYEGQPGNQGGYHQAGQKAYEGQPGNQSGKGGN